MRQHLLALLEPLKTPAYRAMLKKGEPADPCASKFGGIPYFEGPADWPVCNKCKQALFFICQLNLNDCPDCEFPAGEFGLMNLFYCWKCYPCETNQQGWLLDNFANPKPEKSIIVAMPTLPKQCWFDKLLAGQTPKLTKPCEVVLQRFDSVPDYNEFESLISADAKKKLNRTEVVDLFYELHESITGAKDDFGTKVGGYGGWIQNCPEFKCDQCQKPLKFLLQIGSESDAGLMFGDAGAMYFCYCPEHPQVIKMESQCF